MGSEDRPRSRRMEEVTLAESFLKTVLDSGKKVLAERQRFREANNPLAYKVGLTEKEKLIFDRQNYYDWTLGAVTGVSTFGCLCGAALLLSKSSRKLVTQFLKQNSSAELSSSSSVATNAIRNKTTQQLIPSARRYALLDQPAGGAKSSFSQQPHEIPPVHTSQMNTSFMSDQEALQLQVFIFATISVLVGLGTASNNFDHATFYHELADLPLQPGRSFLCASMCPSLLGQRKILVSSIDASGDIHRRAWNDPETEELEAVVRLVQHCQLRIEYQSILSTETERQDEAPLLGTEIMIPAEATEIPEPGVPLQYKY